MLRVLVLSGGQKGHSGHTLTMAETPDHIIVHPVNQCRECNRLIKSIDGTYVSRQVFDIPQLLLEVIEHRAEVKDCPYCGANNQAHFPEEVTKTVSYGNRIKSLSVYLMQYQLLPYERTAELLSDLFSSPISEASLYNWNEKAYHSMFKFFQEVG